MFINVFVVVFIYKKIVYIVYLVVFATVNIDVHYDTSVSLVFTSYMISFRHNSVIAI